MRSRRGSTLALVTCLFLALGAVLLGAVTVSTAAARAADREYRRSVALALADAGIAEARSGEVAHGAQQLGAGTYSWSETAVGSDRLVTAHGSTPAPSGVLVTRTIRVRLAKAGGDWRVRAREEAP